MIKIDDRAWKEVSIDEFKEDLENGISVEGIVISGVAVILYMDRGLRKKKIVFGGYIPQELEEWLGISLRNFIRGYSSVNIIKGNVL